MKDTSTKDLQELLTTLDVEMSFKEASQIRKHSVVIAGHRTSISLENAFWFALQRAAARQNLTIAGLVEKIDEQRSGNLSSAIRVWLLQNIEGTQPKE